MSNKLKLVLITFSFLTTFGLTNTGIKATSQICDNISIDIIPSQATYKTGDVLEVKINHPHITTPVAVHYLRTTQNAREGKAWKQIPLSTSDTQSTGTWTIPNELGAPYPYDKSNNQEFVLSVSVVDNKGFVCSGNPDLPPDFDPEISCDSCRKIVVVEENREQSVSIKNLWVTTPGFSYTFEGRRLDSPLAEELKSICPDTKKTCFTSRIEYEAPVQLCSKPEINVIPQTFTKSNPWGYWGPHIASGNPGQKNLRFFLTSPSFDYPWQNNYLGAVGFKRYNNPSDMNIQTLGNYLDSIRLATFHHDNYYFPPYFQSFDTLSENKVQTFTRNDIAGKDVNGNQPTIPENNFCTPFDTFKYEDHNWLNRTRKLTDKALIEEIYSTLSDDEGKPYFSNKVIYVIQFFESAPGLGGKPFFREDWYFMNEVGLVGIDDISWVENFGTDGTNIPGIDKTSCQKKDSQKNDTEYYFCKDFLKEDDQTNRYAGHAAGKFVKLRLKRAYLGEPLNVSITPSEKTGIYDITAISHDSKMPYDGYLEYETASGELINFVDKNNKGIWIENGKATAQLPENFPTNNLKFRAKVAITPSQDEKILPYQPMPWSEIQSNVPGDTDNNGVVDKNDFDRLVADFGQSNSPADFNKNGVVDIYDYNTLVENFGKP